MRKISLFAAALASVGLVDGTAWAQPVNDNCADATVIGVGATEFDTTDATTDGPDEPACQFPGGNNLINQDIWYAFTAPSTGSYMVSTCSMASYDTRLAVYVAACPVGPDEAIACNDDDPDCEEFTSLLTFEARNRETYLIRVGGFNLGEGPGTLEIIAIPGGEDCNDNRVPDRCDVDCNNEGCEIFPECGVYPDCDGNMVPDECEGKGEFEYRRNPRAPIPDFDPNGLVSTINVTKNGTIADVNVAATITHTFLGDLTIDIAHAGVSVRLWDRQCSLNDDLDIVFDDEGDPVICASPTVGRFQPIGSLREFDFGELEGDWTLTVVDNASLDFGTLVRWGITGVLDSGCGSCTGREQIKRTRCKTAEGKVRAAVVKVKKATAEQEYTATLDTGEAIVEIADESRRVRFKFKGRNAPPCGPNGVTVCDLHEAFDCGC